MPHSFRLGAIILSNKEVSAMLIQEVEFARLCAVCTLPGHETLRHIATEAV